MAKKNVFEVERKVMAIQRNVVISSMLWKLLERFSSQIVSFAISIILARILSPNEYGIIAIIIIFISIANVIIDGGFNTALIQKKDADQTDFSTVFWFCLFLSFVLYAVLFISAPFIARFYGNTLLIPVIRVLSLVIFINSFNSIQRAYVSRHMLFKKLFWVNAVAIVISGTLGIVMANHGYGVWALVGQSLASPLVCCLMMLLTIKWRPSMKFSKSSFRVLFDYGWKIFMTNFIIAVYGDIRGLLIGKFYQPSALAFFDRGKSLPNLLMSNIISSIETVLLPTFANEQEDRIRVKQMIRRSVQVSYFFVLPLLVGFFFAAKTIVLVLLTEKWLPTVPFIRIFCIVFILMPIQNISITAIKSLGYSAITLKLEIIKKIIEAIILVVSFMINVYAVAWGIVLYNFICIFINLSPSKKLVNYGWKEQIKDILPTFVASLLMGAGIYLIQLLPLSNLSLLLLQFVIGVILYLGLGRIIMEENFVYIMHIVKQKVLTHGNC